MALLYYRDLFGGWRWEFRDADGHYRDSRESYETREECVLGAQREGVEHPFPIAGDGGSADRSVLCVQANSEPSELLQQALAHYRVMRVCSSLDAIRCMTSSIFDAYVIDHALPDSSGLHLCRHIRGREPYTPICFLGVSASARQRKQASDAGANGFVCATAGPQALTDEIEALFRAADARSQDAIREEERALHEALRERSATARARSAQVQSLAAAAADSAARAEARVAFLRAGGTPGNFDRWWPAVFASAVVNTRAPE